MPRCTGRAWTTAAHGLGLGLALGWAPAVHGQAVTASPDAPNDVRAPRAPAQSVPYRPADFAVLWPVEFARLTAKALSTEGLRQELRRDLLPLDQIVGPARYAELISSLLTADLEKTNDPSTATNALLPVAAGIRKIDLRDWYVVGARFSPCTPTLPVPATYFAKPAVREVFCRPQIRLSAQPIGFRARPGSAERVVMSDDKTLHLTFDYVAPNADPVAQAALEAAEAKAAGALDKSAVAVDAFAKLVAQHYSSSVRATLNADRQALLRFIDAHRESGSPAESGQLAIPYPFPAAARAYREALAEAVAGARPASITANFATSGAVPGTAETWVFAALRVPREPGSLRQAPTPAHAIRKLPLRFLAATAGAGWVELNPTETFALGMISPASIDWRLRAELGKRGDAAKATLADPLPYGTLIQADGQPENSEKTGEGMDALRQRMRPVLRAMNDPARTGRASLPCSSCHIVDAQQERLGLSGVGELGIGGNRPAVKLELGEKISGAFGWNFRMLGYFENAPSIGARVGAEVRDDVAFANRATIPSSN